MADHPRSSLTGMVSSVREYYDANTWKFLLTGSHRALHRELWGPGVANRRAALQHAHALVLDELGQDDQRVLDLGCGVGTAALYVAQQRPVDVVGVSISPEQIRLAKRFAVQGGPLRGAPGSKWVTSPRFQNTSPTSTWRSPSSHSSTPTRPRLSSARWPGRCSREVPSWSSTTSSPVTWPMAGSTPSGAGGTPRA